MEQGFRNIITFFFIQRTLKIVNIADTKPQKMERDGVCWHPDESPPGWDPLPAGACVRLYASLVLLQPLLYSSGFLTPLLFLLVVHLEDIYCKTFPWKTQVKTKVSIFIH